ncbi:hypothetical protein J6590_019354 [Homalodisca vitripennis]|nr:hypothetical protein J6590_019354 [Homalodisca vitripennis]
MSRSTCLTSKIYIFILPRYPIPPRVPLTKRKSGKDVTTMVSHMITTQVAPDKVESTLPELITLVVVIDSHYSIGQPRSCQTRDSSGCKAERPTNKSVNYGGMECAYVFVGKRTVGPRRKTAGSISYLLLKGWTVGPRPGPWTYCPTHGFLLTRCVEVIHQSPACAFARSPPSCRLLRRIQSCFTTPLHKQECQTIDPLDLIYTRTICFYSVWRLYINLPPALSPVAHHHAACCAGSKVVSRPHFTNKNAKQSTRWILYILGQYVSIVCGGYTLNLPPAFARSHHHATPFKLCRIQSCFTTPSTNKNAKQLTLPDLCVEVIHQSPACAFARSPPSCRLLRRIQSCFTTPLHKQECQTIDSLDLIYTRTICFYSVWRLYINLPPALSPVAYHHAACCAGSKCVEVIHQSPACAFARSSTIMPFAALIQQSCFTTLIFTNKNAKQSTRWILYIYWTICFYSVEVIHQSPACAFARSPPSCRQLGCADPNVWRLYINLPPALSPVAHHHAACCAGSKCVEVIHQSPACAFARSPPSCRLLRRIQSCFTTPLHKQECQTIDPLDLIYTRTICFYSVWRLYINLPPALSPVAHHHAACCAGSKVVSRPHFTNKNAKQSSLDLNLKQDIGVGGRPNNNITNNVALEERKQ